MKTRDMESIELRDWELRRETDPTARKRDIREIIQAAFEEGKRLKEAARIVGVDHTTLSFWINHHLGGELASRVLFPGFEPDLKEAA